MKGHGFALEFTVALRLICLSGCRPSGSVIEHWLSDADLLKRVLPFLWETSRHLCLILLLCSLPISVRYSVGKNEKLRLVQCFFYVIYVPLPRGVCSVASAASDSL